MRSRGAHTRKLKLICRRCEVTDFKKVFFDTAPFIYYLEDDGDFYKKAEKLFIDGRNGDYLTSTITVGEYLTGAFRENDDQKASDS